MSSPLAPRTPEGRNILPHVQAAPAASGSTSATRDAVIELGRILATSANHSRHTVISPPQRPANPAPGTESNSPIPKMVRVVGFQVPQANADKLIPNTADPSTADPLGSNTPRAIHPPRPALTRGLLSLQIKSAPGQVVVGSPAHQDTEITDSSDSEVSETSSETDNAFSETSSEAIRIIMPWERPKVPGAKKPSQEQIARMKAEFAKHIEERIKVNRLFLGPN